MRRGLSYELPIPSGKPSMENGTSEMGGQQSTTTSTATADNNPQAPTDKSMMQLPITEQGMKTLESALQLHLKGNSRLSYQDFCKCVSKMVGVSSALVVAVGSGKKDDSTKKNTPRLSSLPDDSAILQLSREERFWHDLYCVAVPTLYRLDDEDESSGKNSGDLVVVALPAGQNRFREMCRLAKAAMERGVPEEKSKQAVDLLLSLLPPDANSKQAKAAVQTTKATPTNEVAEALLGKNRQTAEPAAVSTTSSSSSSTGKPSTIEERIRVRAQEREQHVKDAEAAQKDPREDLVAVADLLYTHACQVLRRINKSGGSRFQINKANKAKSSCVLTFEDVVNKVIPNRPRKDIALLFDGIVKASPSSKFLRWRDPKAGRNGLPLSKGASVWIDTADYKRVRAVLNGEEPPAPATSTEHTPVSSPTIEKNDKPPVVTVSSKKMAPVPSATFDSAASLLSKKRPAPRDDLPRASKTLKSLTAAAARTSSIASQSRASAVVGQSAGTKRQGADLEAQQQQRKKKIEDNSWLEDSDSDESFLNKPALNHRPRYPDSSDDDDESLLNNNRSRQQVRKASPSKLRVNPDHILWDHDHDGGIVIQPSSELPRGLRRLFHALNNGERI